MGVEPTRNVLRPSAVLKTVPETAPVTPPSSILDQSSIRWKHLIKGKLIYFNELEKLVRVRQDEGRSRDTRTGVKTPAAKAESGASRPVTQRPRRPGG